MPRTASPTRFIARNFGTCLFFDGADDTVIFADSNSLDITDKITISAWIYPIGFGESSVGRIVNKNDSGTTGYSFMVKNDTGTASLQLQLDNSLYTSNSSLIRLRQWQWVAWTFDKDAGSDQIKFYKNAVAAGVATRSTAMTANTDSLTIGNKPDTTRTFSGFIDEVKVFNVALTAEQISNEYYVGYSDQTPILYAKFDEGSGTSAIDISGNQSAGTISGCVYSSNVVCKARNTSGSRSLSPNRSAVS